MTPPFPLSPEPAWFTYARWLDADTNRNGVFYEGDTVTVKLNAAGATAYSVRDYFGSVVRSGSMSGTTVSLGSSWDPGWYRIYFTGANTDPVFGPAYAATNFCVLRDDPNFKPMPAGDIVSSPVGNSLGEYNDQIMRGVMGLGIARLRFYTFEEPAFSGPDYVSPDYSTTWLGKEGEEADYGREWWTESGYVDPARPRYMWCATAVLVNDQLDLPASSGDWMRVYLADDSLDGTLVHVRVAAGSVSGKKITVEYPTAGAIVETYDNLADAEAAQTAINPASDYIRAYNSGGSGPTNMTATAIGDATRSAAVGGIGYLYDKGVTHFEGPSNEPTLSNDTSAEEIAHLMKLFAQTVHAANPNAVAMGPTSINIDYGDWKRFLDAGGVDHIDEISFHDYNSMSNGDLALGRYSIERFNQLLSEYPNARNKNKWQTEANNTLSSVYGVYHPRRSSFNLLHTLLWEQYGMPRERNVMWYDTSHGYWQFPSFIKLWDESLNPNAVLLRVLAEETFGKVYDERLRFGHIGDKLFLGSVYRGDDDSAVIVIMPTSHMDGATVTLDVTGATSITSANAFGAVSTSSVVDGQVTVSLEEVAAYIRLPAGVEATVAGLNDWGSASLEPSISDLAVDVKVGSTFTMIPADDSLATSYSSTLGTYFSPGTLPENITLLWGQTVDVDRVIVVCGQSWQNAATLVAFAVQTTTNGTTWTTRETVTKPTPSSFAFGTNWTNAGCSRETYWDEQWVFDVALPSTYSCTGVRIAATAASYGGEPDAAAVAAGGQGNATPHVVIQEVFVPSSSLPASGTASKTASFNLGTDGATITTLDVGNLTQWDAVSGTPTYDSSEAAHGHNSMLLSTGETESVSWDLADLTDHYGRFMLRQGVHSGVPRIVRFYDNGTMVAEFQVNQLNQLRLGDGVGTEIDGITNLDPGRWYRIEYHITHSATVGQMRARIYDDATGDLREAIISPATLNTGTKTDQVFLGAVITGSPQQHWMDEIAVDADGFIGAVSEPQTFTAISTGRIADTVGGVIEEEH